VLVNVQLDLRRSQRRSATRSRGRAAEGQSWRARLGSAAVRGLKTAGTLTTIALLWSLWSSPNLAAWLELMRRGILGA
jgi:hypothetical protein